MQETAVIVAIEVVSVHDPAGLKTYVQRASELIGPLGGKLVAQGGTPIDGEPSFAPLVIQRWPSEAAFRAWLASDASGTAASARLVGSAAASVLNPISGAA